MGIGSAVRHRLGRFEAPISEMYRSRYINLVDLATTVASLGSPDRILEIGCGEGAFASELLRLLPEADYVGTDIGENTGRMFEGDPSRAQFRQLLSRDLVAEAPTPFDLVLLVDVIHHVPLDARQSVLEDAAELTAPGGVLVVKEWDRLPGMATRFAYLADRYITGDPNVVFATRAELLEQLGAALKEFEPMLEARVPPRRNNLLLAFRKPANT